MAIEEIIVTARRRAERLIDAPVAITAVSGAKLEAYAVSDLTDITNLVPSMVVGRAASGSGANIYLRGVGSTSLSAGFDQSVSFIIDGLPMSRGREIGLSQYDVQHVEVLKGPQALFFGKNTTGGLISIVTNGPTTTFEAGAKVGYGFKAAEKYGEGYVSGPLTDALRARLAVRLSDSEGSFKNSAADTYPTPLGLFRHKTADHRGFGETQSGRLSIQWEPSEAFRWDVKLGATRQKDGGATDSLERLCGAGRSTPATANGVPPSANADCRVNGVSDGSDLPPEVTVGYRYARDGGIYADLISSFGVLTGEIDLDKVSISTITSYYRFKQTDLNNVSGEGYPASFTQYSKFDQFAQEVRVQTKFEGPFNLMFGAFGANGDFTFNTDAYIFNVPLDPVRGTYTTFKRDNGFKSDTISAFAEATYDVTEQIELSAGARWTHEERDSFQRSLPGHIAFAAAFPGNIFLQDKFKDENVSPQATVRYKPAEDVSFYASYKQGFKSGGFNISQSLIPSASVAAGRYGSETARGFEGGVRALLLNRSLSVSLTAYNYLYEDLQVQNFDPVTIGQVVANVGELRTRGFEGDVEWLPEGFEGLSLRGAFAYNRATYNDYVGQCYGGQTIQGGCNLVRNGAVFTSQDYDGRTPPKAPRFAGRLGASYEVPVGAEMALQFSGDLGHTSKYNFSDALRPDAIQKAYTKFDAAVRLIGPDDRWKLSLIGKNLSNELNVLSAADIPFTGGAGTGSAVGVLSDQSAGVDNPREIILEFSAKF